jgi:long-chain acyl-CoA synthetase
LRARGVQRGDRVAIFLENSIELVVSVFAALEAGGVFVVINPTTKAGKLAFLLDASGAAALISDATVRPILDELRGRPAALARRGAQRIRHDRVSRRGSRRASGARGMV